MMRVWNTGTGCPDRW